MGAIDAYDIIVREGDKVYAVSLPPIGRNRALVRDIDTEERFLSPLKWIEKIEDVENAREFKVISGNTKVKVTSYPTYDIIEYSGKKYVGKVITKPWSLRPIFIFSDEISSSIKVIDMEKDAIRELNIDSDSVLPFETSLCGGVHYDRVIVNMGGKSFLYSIFGAEDVKTILEIPHALTEVHGTTVRGLAFVTSSSTSLSASSYFANCYGQVVRVTNSPLDINDVLLDKDWLVLVLRMEALSSLKGLEVVGGSRLVLLKANSYEVNAASVTSRRHVFVDDIAWLLDINERYVIVKGGMDITIYDRWGKIVSEFNDEELPCDIPGECLFHPRHINKLLYINEMAKPDSIDISD